MAYADACNPRHYRSNRLPSTVSDKEFTIQETDSGQPLVGNRALTTRRAHASAILSHGVISTGGFGTAWRSGGCSMVRMVNPCSSAPGSRKTLQCGQVKT
jgi:hypothetical protein